MAYSSKYIEQAVNEFTKLPSIGRKSAFRLVLHLINKDKSYTDQFISAIQDMKDNLKYCQTCYNLSDDVICSVCSNPSRDHSMLCVVESVKDVIAIEETQHYNGVYHVLGGVISPLEGIGPDDIKIKEFHTRVHDGEISEIIMALNPTIEGDTTIFYLSKQMNNKDIKISTLSRGVAFGSELEYTDELTLGRSILARIPYQDGIKV